MVSVVCMMYVGLVCNVGHHGLCGMHGVRGTYMQCKDVRHHSLCCMHDVRRTYVQCRASWSLLYA